MTAASAASGKYVSWTKRQEIAMRKAQVHFSEDPDYIAFGPFLALGAAVYMALEPVFYNNMIETITLFGLAF